MIVYFLLLNLKLKTGIIKSILKKILIKLNMRINFYKIKMF